LVRRDGEFSGRKTDGGCSLLGGAVLYRACWTAWLLGTILIVLSWFGIVSATIGWSGFGIACLAALMSSASQRSSSEKVPECAVLTREMVETKGHSYEVAMDCLRRGGAVLYDGITVGVRAGAEMACIAAASWPVADLDDVRVSQDVERVKAVFETLTRLSPELAALSADKKLSVSLVSEYGTKGIEICRVGEEGINWKVKGK
jgi:hypothetical protein